jgi:hypothetical protein
MIICRDLGSSGMLISIGLSLIFCSLRAREGESASLSPPGVADFAGKAAHNYWYLFGDSKRNDLEALNRELRQAQRQFDRARQEDTRREAVELLTKPAAQLLEIVKSCPCRIRLDLTSGHPALSPSGPFELPGETGALLFEVVSGGDGVSYRTSTTDVSQMGMDGSPSRVDVAERGTTYALVGFEHLPVGRNMMRFDFQRAGQPAMSLSAELTTPPPGRLKVTVLSDDTGKPTPAMVRLVWRVDGVARPPANAVDFSLQFENQGNVSIARNANLPGPLGETFWCAPGPFDMTLSPGQWQITARRGVEHEVMLEDVTIHSGETVERVYRPRHWVDMRKRGWWSGDDHVHCRVVSDADARNLMAWAQAEDLHLLNMLKVGDIYRTYFEQRGFGPGYRVVEGQYILSPGQECPRTHDQIGHTIALDTSSMVRNTERYFLYDEVADAVHAQGGLWGYAHANSGNFHVDRDMTLNVPRQKADFAEILQFGRLGTRLYDEFLNLGCKLTAAAGSDVPWGGTVGEVRVYAYLGNEKFSADTWFDAFRRGRTFTTSGPMLDFRVDNALPGDEIQFKTNKKLRVRGNAWGDPKRMGPIKLEIIRHGEVIGSTESADSKKPEAHLDLSVDAGFGCWIAARAVAGDGTRAYTTPVYIVRDGLRFWKFEALDDLFERRERSLAQIERIVAEAKQLAAEGKLEQDRNRQELARQGDLLLERVAAARKLYDELKRVAETERGLRATLRTER